MSKIITSILSGVAAIAVVIVGSITPAGASSARPGNQYTNHQLQRAIVTILPLMKHCQFEGSRNCAWDATTPGSGVHRSFVDLNGTPYFVSGGVYGASGYGRERVAKPVRLQHAIRVVATVLRPCPQEDSRNCYWDAGHRGNGIGHSFVDLNGTAYYLRGPVRGTPFGTADLAADEVTAR